MRLKRGISIGPLRSLRDALFRRLCDAPRESTVRGSIDFHGGDCMARRPKLTQEMVGEAIRLKADGNDHSIDAVRYAMMDDVLRG